MQLSPRWRSGLVSMRTFLPEINHSRSDMKRWLVWSFLCLVFSPAVKANEPIRLANNPALSPLGQWLAFDWNGDIWIAPATGGDARQLTAHPARDSQPRFS